MRVILCVITFIVAGCAADQALVQVPMSPSPVSVAVEPSSPPMPTDLETLIASDPLHAVRPSEALASIARANRQAIVRPRQQDFQKSIVVYPSCEGCIFAIEVGFDVLMHLYWPPEEMVTKVKGDDWFEVEHKRVGEPPQDYVFIKSNLSAKQFPHLARKPFTFTIVTTIAVYTLSVRTHDDTQKAMTAVTWKHPEPVKRTAVTTAHGRYHAGYTLWAPYGQRPIWTPVGVWDTGDWGGQTLIQFPKARQTHDAPVLFILAPNGERHVTNYRPKGDWYIVDRLFELAELRVGHDEYGQSITITRDLQAPIIQCPGDAACPTGALP